MEKESLTIFDQNVIEFVTVAASYCNFMEQSEGTDRKKFVGTAIKLLPLLYLKASLLPPCSALSLDEVESYVTEDIYEIQRISIANIMGEQDDYLDSFVSELEYSDEPIKKDVSEDLTDIYQDIKDFVFVFKLGLNETMNDALVKCEENFKTIWGPKLLSTLRALHYIWYKFDEREEDVDENGEHEKGSSKTDDCDCNDEDCHCHHHHE
jgi:hypothetical protein